jgi:hypothetical protein
MRRVIFYSWQSDLPNSTNRGLIQSALENAAASISGDNNVSVEPVVDRDTQGVAGSPDIAATIFAKITAADVFVADVSIISHPENGRPTPNPNVLIELGYALRGLGHERMILVFNEAFGKINGLPFDLRVRRLMTYNMPEAETDRASGRKKLESQFKEAILAALNHAPTAEEPQSIPAVAAIEANQANRVVTLRRNLDEILKKIESLEPKKHSEGGTVVELIHAIDQTQEVVAEFSKIAEIISVMNDQVSALECYRWFGKLFVRYNRAEGHTGLISNADGDYFKFVGHELFVTFIAFLMREQQWELIGNLVAEPIPMAYLHTEYGPGNVYWDFASQHISLLLDESRARRRISLHADILHERHSTGGLAAILPFNEFTSADFSLFLLGELPPPDVAERMAWRAWSCLFMKHAPAFIKNAEQTKTAQRIVNMLGLKTIDEFKARLSERVGKLARLFRDGLWDLPIQQKDIDRIGTR